MSIADADRSPLRRRPNATAAAAAHAESSSSSSSSASVSASPADFSRPDEAAASTGEDSEGGISSSVAPPLPDRDDARGVCNGPASAAEGGGGPNPATVTLANEYAVARWYRPSMPAHRRVKESPLSSDSIFNQSHAGLLNLCIVVLVAVNGRLIIENLMKYGLLIRTGFWFSSKSLKDWPLLMCCLTLPIFPLCSFVVEKLASRKWVSEPIVISLHVIITTGVLLYPALVILRCDSAVLSGIHLMLFASTYWLKLVSYAHTNYDLRTLSESKDKDDVNGPYDVNLKSLAYFMVAPTLCYQTSYPRTTCIRKGWVTRQFVKFVIFTGLMGFIIEQYINPIVKNSQHPLKGNFLYCMERVLKLSVPTLYVWLCMFYCFFHLWLNILAELLCFGDREFYKDWWNAKTIDEYWRMWNMPVHKWMARHVYFPCLRCGLSKGVAVLVAFFISAIFHELCVGVPCHIFKFWAFIGIMFQVPLVVLTNYLRKKFRNDMVGNIIFWSFFSIFGQPMCVLLYYHDVTNRKVKTTP